MPSRPAVWSKWPWLSTTASTSRGSTSSRRMFSTIPSGLTPQSKSNRCVRPSVVRDEAVLHRPQRQPALGRTGPATAGGALVRHEHVIDVVDERGDGQ